MDELEKIQHIYIMRAGSTMYFKVGRTSNIERRLEAINNGNPLPVIPVGLYFVENPLEVEYFLHHKLSKYHAKREWFHLTTAALEQLKKRLQEIELPCDCAAHASGEYVEKIFNNWPIFEKSSTKEVLPENQYTNIDRNSWDAIAKNKNAEIMKKHAQR